MNKNKIAPYILLILLALLVLVLRRCMGDRKEPTRNSTKRNTSGGRNRGFDRTVNYLEYTQHARCRMDCRKISQADVKEIMQEGNINYRKSDVKDKPCPTYALEGYTDDREHLRVVFAQCATKTKVVTCINLDEEFECHCPGDDKN